MDLLIKCNVGQKERLLRMLVGVAAGAGAYFVQDKRLKAALGALSFAGVGTAVSRYCPVNDLLGIRNCQPYNRSLKQVIRRL